jgi:regulator of sirC expression with transglutaminase-like and TPR domain
MNVHAALEQLAQDSQARLDLAELALSLARDEYPDLDVEAYLNELAGMAHEAKHYLGGRLESCVSGLCRFLFHEMGFRGNKQKYYDPRNSYLNQVLDRRTGIPITLTLVAMAVGQRVGMQINGVGLPGHFIAKAIDEGQEVLFDPFHGGRQLTAGDCENLVQKATGEPFHATAENLRPQSPQLIVIRLLSNLKAAYLRLQDFPKAIRIMERLRQISPQDPLQQRDLGVILVQAGQPGRAIEHLSSYLTVADDSSDAASVRTLLQQAFGDVAKWN